MKKMWILTIALIALAAVGSLYAVSVDSTQVAVSSMDAVTAGIAGLPTTVLDQLSNEAAGCIRPDIYCLDVYDPVTCSDGVTYSNACYAYLACATGCTGGGSQS